MGLIFIVLAITFNVTFNHQLQTSKQKQGQEYKQMIRLGCKTFTQSVRGKRLVSVCEQGD